MLYLTLKTLVSYCFVCISLHADSLYWQKLTQKLANTYLCVQTDSG